METNPTTTPVTSTEPQVADRPVTTEPVAPERPLVPAAKTEAPAAKTDAPVTPKSYTEEDIERAKNSVKGGYEGTISQLKAQVAELARAKAEAETASRESYYTRLLAAAENRGEDTTSVKEFIQKDRETTERAARLAAKEAEIAAQMALINEAGFNKQVNELIGKYELSKDAAEKLKVAKSSEEMESIALRLAYTAMKSNSAPARKVDSPIGSVPQVPDNKQLPSVSRLGMALEQDSANRKR